MKHNRYITAIYFTVALLIINTITVYADPGPGGGDPGICDPDDTSCPLDTWVILLVAIALIYTTLHLYRKQKLAGRLA